ncbi:hypothetical protein [Bradyrhizobium diazoefficiens]
MRFITGHSLDRGRVVISKDAGIVAVAPSVEALALVSHAGVVGEELRAHPHTMRHVRRWIIDDAKRRTRL